MQIDLISTNNASPAIALTHEYLVFNGKHTRIKNGYFYKQNNAVSILIKDILSIEKTKMRSKRLLVIGLVAFSLISVIFGLQKTFSKPISKTVDVIDAVDGIINGDEETYKDSAEKIIEKVLEENELYGIAKKANEYYDKGSGAIDDVNKIVNGDITPITNKVGGNFLAFIYVVLFLISTLCITGYILCPYHLIRISALGNDVAVNINSYDKDNVTAFINGFYTFKTK